MASYKESYPLQHRQSESKRALEMGKIPIICERRGDSALPELSTKKFIVAPTMSVGMFIKVLTERVNTEVAQRIFLYLGDSVLMAQKIAMSDLYRVNKDPEDGFIYVTYSSDKSNAARQLGAYHITHTDAERQEEADEVLQRGLLPVVVEKDEDSPLRDLSNDKFEIEPQMPVSTFVQLVGTRVALELGHRIYLYVEDFALAMSEQPMADVYERFKQADGFLYITFSGVAPQDGMPSYPDDDKAAQSRDVSPIQSPEKSRSISMEEPYKDSHSDAERRAAAEEALDRNKIPIIVEKRPGSSLADISNNKFVVEPTMLVSKFISLLSERVADQVEQEIHLFIGDNVLTAKDITTKELYESNKDADGLLYITYDDNDSGARHMGVYKSTHSESHRLDEATRALALFKTPIIVEKVYHSQAREMEQRKFWVPFEMPVTEFTELLRTRIADETNQKVHLFIDGRPVNPKQHKTMKLFYDAHKDEDNFVYVTYSDRPSANQ